MNTTTQRILMAGWGACLAAGCALPGEDSGDSIGTVLQQNTVDDGALSVVFTKTADWGTGYNGQVAITNVTDAVVSDWNLYFTLPAATTVDWCFEEGQSTPSCGPFEPRNGEKAKQLFPAGDAAELAPGETVIYNFGGTGSDATEIVTWASCQYNGLVDGAFQAGQIPCDGSDDIEHPAAPQNLSVSDATETTFVLDWEESPETDVVAYRVYGPGGPVADVLQPGVVVTNPTPRSPASYRVTAIDGAGNISLSSSSASVDFVPQQVSFDLQVVSSWSGGYQADIVLTNEGSELITDFSFDFSQEALDSLWGADYSQSGSSVRVVAADYANVVAPGTSVTIGYGVSGSETLPESFTFRGATCLADGTSCVASF